MLRFHRDSLCSITLREFLSASWATQRSEYSELAVGKPIQISMWRGAPSTELTRTLPTGIQWNCDVRNAKNSSFGKYKARKIFFRNITRIPCPNYNPVPRHFCLSSIVNTSRRLSGNSSSSKRDSVISKVSFTREPVLVTNFAFST